MLFAKPENKSKAFLFITPQNLGSFRPSLILLVKYLPKRFGYEYTILLS
jgi:hypothetical protein